MKELVRKWKEFEEYLITTRYAVRNPETGNPLEKTWEDLVNRFEPHLKKENVKYNGGFVSEYEIEEVITAIRNKYIIPASPFLMSFGNPYTKRKGYFSCYPLGFVEDSMDGIYKTCEMMKEIYIRGGGVGIDVSKLRPKNSMVDSGQGIASGPVGFLSLFDAVTGTTNQGGRRRGALLVQMHWKHPDIEKFIKAKSHVPAISQVVYSLEEDERIDIPLQNMNISVVVDDEFWIKGQHLFKLIAEQMWKSGDPGMLFVNNMKKFSPFNPAEYGEQDEPIFSNPCGEYLAPAFSACNLITVNVAKLAYESISKNGDFQHDAFFRSIRKYAEIATLLGSLLVETDEGYPLEEIKTTTKRLRPVGIGMTGFHTALILAYKGNVRYGKDEEAIKFAEKTQISLTIGTLVASSKLTEKYKKIYKWTPEYLQLHTEELKEGIEKYKLPLKEEINYIIETANRYKGFYNSVTTSQPPTGSVSQFAYVAGDTGIEPMYAIELTRRVRDFTTGNWKEVTLSTLYIAHLLGDKNTRKKIENQLAYSISPVEQLTMLEAFQKYVHTGISKTINVPQSTSIEDIQKLIEHSKKARLKGFTVFRENCRVDTVYVSRKEEKGEKEELPYARKAFVYEIRGPVKAYVTTTFDEVNRIREVFISVGKAGTTLNGMFQAFGRVISVALRRHPDLVDRLVKTLEGIETGEFYVCNEITAKSIPDMVAKLIKHSLELVGTASTKTDKKETDQTTGDLCPICGKLTVFKQGACKTCKNCEYTTC